jgi:hypothetical protein
MYTNGAKNVRQYEKRTAELLVPELSACALDMAIEKVNRHKLPDSD